MPFAPLGRRSAQTPISARCCYWHRSRPCRPTGHWLRESLASCSELDANDTRLVYEAIRLAAAGGLGRTENADVFSDPPANLTLVDAMQLAAERDRVARQFTNQFADVLGGTAASIADSLARGLPLSDAIVFAHIRQIAKHGDSLIARKCGPEIAAEARQRAMTVIDVGFARRSILRTSTCRTGRLAAG